MSRLPLLRAATAALLSAAITAAALVFTPPPASAAPADITEGSFVWGIKESWRKYIADGSTTGDGATITAQIPNGTQVPYPEAFSFPIETGSYDPDTKTTTLDLNGYVHFQSWFGQVTPGQYALDTTFSDLTVTISPTTQEIRGTHTGYSRTDPGGALHVDEDVVLATMDVTSATTSFADDATNWTGVATTAGDGFSIYPTGTTLDRASISYTGPGGAPDLSERFDQPGAPVLKKEGTWLSRSTATMVGGPAARAVEVSPKGDVVYAFEASNGTEHNLEVTALDATTMQPVGTPFVRDIGYYSGGEDRRRFRTTIDPTTDTLFFVSAEDGPSDLETRVNGLRFDRDSGTFTEFLVGQLPAATTGPGRPPGVPDLGNLAWNAERGELAVLEGNVDAVSMHRFVRTSDEWAHQEDAFEPSATGPLEGMEFPQHKTVGFVDVPRSLVAASDGSYVLATDASTYYVQVAPDDYQERPMPVLHARVTGDGLVVTPVADSTTRPAFGLNYGYTDAIAGRAGSVIVHGAGQGLDDYLTIEVNGATATATDPVVGPDRFAPHGYSLLGTSVAVDLDAGRLWLTDPLDPAGQPIKLMRGGDVEASYTLPEFGGTQFGQAALRIGGDGALFVPIKDGATGRYGYLRWGVVGVAPAVTDQPEAVEVELDSDEPSRQVTFSADVDEELGGDLQWQAKTVGASKFTDISGATSPTLVIAAGPQVDGSRYRLKVSNEAGTVVSDEAALTVTYGPRFVVQPKSVSARPGTIANFNAEVIANPGTTSIGWQRKTGGYWVDIANSDDNFSVSGSALTVRETDADQTGTQFRLKAVSPLGTAYSSVAKLTVEAEPVASGVITGADLVWTGSQELQKAPPFGGSSFFSAGVSDGKEPTYRAVDGKVSVVHIDDNTRTPATWATRAAQVATDLEQAVVVEDGTGTLDEDGSAVIAWDGAWTVNFYGGLVPFTVTDPVLTVDEEGNGTLKGDLSGYGSTQDNPDVRTPLAPVADVTIATFSDVDVDSNGFTIGPDYEGVQVQVANATAQVRTGDWGSWPQPFVDFHVKTGLSSYWYSSGGAADAYKSPSPIQVGSFTVSDKPAIQAPVIALQPSSVSAIVGTAAQLRVTATGSDLSYLWQRKVGSSWIDLSDERSATLTLPATTLADGGAQLRVKVSNSAGSVTSAGATLTVKSARTTATISRSKGSQKIKAPAKRRVLLRVRVTSEDGASPTGRVRFYDGSRKIGTAQVRNGKAQLRVPASLKRGTHRITATYEPSVVGRFAGSTTKVVTVKVKR